MISDRPRAAVAVLVRGLAEDRPEVLLGRRRTDPSDPWSGQIALPGGRRIPEDRDLLDTALRECEEESGIALPRGRAVCALPDIVAGKVTGRHVPVRPWLIRADSDSQPSAGDGEMVDWGWFPLASLDDPKSRTDFQLGGGRSFPGIPCMGSVLWGMTLRVLEGMWNAPIVKSDRWWLDFDGTVYPASHPLTERLDHRITEWVASARGLSFADADLLRQRLYHEYGNTLRGMMRETDADPNAYLDFVFELPDSILPRPDPRLAMFLDRLARPAAIFTNARADYVSRCLKSMEISRGVGAIHDIASFTWRAKPESKIYREVLEREGAHPGEVVFVDDRVENLHPSRELGIRGILIDESDRHHWLDVSTAGSDPEAEPAESTPYHAKIASGSDLLWLGHPRMGASISSYGDRIG